MDTYKIDRQIGNHYLTATIDRTMTFAIRIKYSAYVQEAPHLK